MFSTFESTAHVSLVGLLLVGGLSGAVGCSKKSSAPADPGAASASASSPPAPSTQAPWTRKGGLIGDRLATESVTRPTGTPSVETAFAAFGKAGVPVEGVFQSLASTMHAQYCSVGKTGSGLYLVVCEYSDEAAAVAGKEMVKGALASLKRDYFVNKKTTLAVQLMEKTPAAEADAKTVEKAFSAL